MLSNQAANDKQCTDLFVGTSIVLPSLLKQEGVAVEWFRYAGVRRACSRVHPVFNFCMRSRGSKTKRMKLLCHFSANFREANGQVEVDSADLFEVLVPSLNIVTKSTLGFQNRRSQNASQHLNFVRFLRDIEKIEKGSDLRRFWWFVFKRRRGHPFGAFGEAFGRYDSSVRVRRSCFNAARALLGRANHRRELESAAALLDLAAPQERMSLVNLSPRSPRAVPLLPPDKSLNHLPPEILKHVLEFLPADQLVRVGRVCTLWLALSRHSSIWRYQFRREFHDWYDSSIAATLKALQDYASDDIDSAGLADWRSIFWKTTEVHNNWISGRYSTKTFTDILRTVRTIEIFGNLMGNTSGAQVFLWDLDSGKNLGALRPPNTSDVRSFRFLDRNRVVCTGGPGSFCCRDSNSADFVPSLPVFCAFCASGILFSLRMPSFQ